MTTKKQHLVEQSPPVNQEVATLAVVPEDTELDALFAENEGVGFENVSADQIIFPQLVILQPQSPQITAEGPIEYRAGDIIDRISGRNFGKEFRFYIVSHFVSRTQWASPDPGSEIVCRSQDGVTGSQKDAAHGGGVCGKCPLKEFTTDPKTGASVNPACTYFINLIVQGANEEGVFLYSAKRSALKPTNVLLSTAITRERKGRPVPIFGASYSLKSVRQQADTKVFYVPQFESGELIGDATLFRALRDKHERLKKVQSKIVVDHQDRDEELTVDAEYKVSTSEEETVRADDEIDF